MSSNEPANQFFPSYLKWASIIFFGLTALAVVAITSPRLLRDHTNPAIGDLPQPQQTLHIPDNDVSAATSSAGLLATSPTPLITSQQSITVVEDDLPAPTSLPSPARGGFEADADTTGSEHCQYSGNQAPKIIGITYDGHRYYYAPGSQPYYALQKLVKIDDWFCWEDDATVQGWVEGPENILDLLQQEEKTSASNTNNSSHGLLHKVLHLLGM